jgi:hypothetical protein
MAIDFGPIRQKFFCDVTHLNDKFDSPQSVESRQAVVEQKVAGS